jgi:hypothetical protein
MNNRLRVALVLVLGILHLSLLGCSGSNPSPDAGASSEADAEELEPIARTEFTDRVENFFEYESLHAGKPSQFRIHLTDLSDGAPVEKAEVTLTVRPKGGADTTVQTTAKVGKVTGIYVVELNVPRSGEYDIEFHIKNAKLDERLPLTNFKVE